MANDLASWIGCFTTVDRIAHDCGQRQRRRFQDFLVFSSISAETVTDHPMYNIRSRTSICDGYEHAR
jgi:hypothetical protein